VAHLLRPDKEKEGYRGRTRLLEENAYSLSPEGEGLREARPTMPGVDLKKLFHATQGAFSGRRFAGDAQHKMRRKELSSSQEKVSSGTPFKRAAGAKKESTPACGITGRAPEGRRPLCRG